jgi:2-polyprenyl-6-hydroxyphenyl methylase/3-demethylubiquinone-9 3-methyltransferase
VVAGLWHRAKGRATVLDYGGGNGRFAAVLAQHGLACESVDIFHGSQDPSQADYGIVTCFEVIEHVPHALQLEWLAQVRRHLAPQGLILMSTEVLDASTPVDHYYIAPRNGHVSIHSPKSLRTLARNVGLEIYSINGEMHLLRPSHTSADA